jgi:hypothetical protein
LNERKFTKAWNSCESVKDVCKKLKITEASAYYWARKFGLPMFCGTAGEESPSPEEIAERAAEIRESWSEEETQRRAVGRCRGRYEVPSYASSHSSSSRWPVFTGA